MEKLKIGFFECEGWEKTYIEEIYPYINKIADIDYFGETLQEALKKHDIGKYNIISVFIYSSIDKKMISLLKNTKVIITRSMGYDHIDIQKCKEEGIEVYNIYDYGTNTVAEYTLLLMLMLLRKMKKIFYDYEIHNKIDPKEMRGEELTGKTVGVIGTGNIGTRVIELLQPFNVNVLAYSRHKKEELERKYHIKYKSSLEEVLKESDIITLHVPLTPQTYHLINKNNIYSIKKGAYIINTSRGGVIDTESILLGIKEGIIKGIAMDVFEGEKLERIETDLLLKSSPNVEELKRGWVNQILKHGEKVLLTPHIAYDTEEAIKRIIDTTIEIILSYSSNTQERMKKYRVS